MLVLLTRAEAVECHKVTDAHILKPVAIVVSTPKRTLAAPREILTVAPKAKPRPKAKAKTPDATPDAD